MEENKNKKEKVNHKLSYDELETAAKQISAQLDALARENNQLRIALQKAQLGNLYTELEFKFKVVQNAEMFSSEFVERCIKNIEEIMTPEPEETEEKEDEQA
jgi:hypothetical protein